MHTKYPDFWSVLLGNGNHGFLFGYIVLSLISAMGMIVVIATRKYQEAAGTPNTWSWKYFWANNIGNIIAGFVLIPIFIRLVYQYADPGWMIVVSIGIGFGFLGLAKVANSLGVWTTSKLSERIAQKVNDQQVNNPPSSNNKN